MSDSNTDTVLANLAREINEHEDAKRACETKGAMHGIRVGQLLIDAKKVTPHGGFLSWVSANTKVSARMAQMYMGIADSKQLLEMVELEYETVSHLTVRKAVELAGKEKRMQREQAAFDERLEEIAIEIEKISEERCREIAEAMRAAREARFKGDDAAFVSWLVHKAHVGKITAERAPALLDKDYDSGAWLEVMLADIADGSSLRSTKEQDHPASERFEDVSPASRASVEGEGMKRGGV